jgi:hypothetical protein
MTSFNTSQGGPSSTFFTLMVGALVSPSGGPPSTSSSTSVVATAGPVSSAPHGARHWRPLQTRWWPLSDPSAAPPKGPTIDVFFNLGGGHCWTHRKRPPRGATIDSGQHPPGGRHRRPLQPRWWPLPNPSAAPPRVPAIDVFFNLGGGGCRTRRQHPQGARHRCLFQTRWWTLSDPPTAPLEGPLSTSCN